MPKKGETKSNATADSKRQRAYNSQPEQKKRRAQRNAARRKMEKKVGKAAIKGKDIDHKDMNTGNNSNGNLRVQSKAKNRARNRGTGGRKKGK